MRVFPDDNFLDSACRSISGEAAKALVSLKGGRIAEDAVSVIEDWFEPSLEKARLLADLDETIRIHSSEGDQGLLRPALKARAVIAASPEPAPDDYEPSFKVVPATTLGML